MRLPLLAAALLLAACASTSGGERRAAVGADASSVPALTLAGSGGTSRALADLHRDGPLYLYFIKDKCPVNHHALPYYARLYEALGEPKAFVGVIHGDADLYAAWQAQYQAPYPVLLDPDKAWIRHFEAERSPWVVEVLRDGSVGRVWRGYGVDAIAELNEALADTRGVEPAEIDTAGLPELGKFG